MQAAELQRFGAHLHLALSRSCSPLMVNYHWLFRVE